MTFVRFLLFTVALLICVGPAPQAGNFVHRGRKALAHPSKVCVTRLALRPQHSRRSSPHQAQHNGENPPLKETEEEELAESVKDLDCPGILLVEVTANRTPLVLASLEPTALQPFVLRGPTLRC